MKIILLALSLFFSAHLFSQLPSGTDVFLADCILTKSLKAAKDPINISNRKGYDNQSFFSKDGKQLYYVSVKEDGQSDVYAYTLATKSTIQITHTLESEYSPKPTLDGKYISVVRVEKDSAQLFWKYLIKDKKPFVICSNIDSIGYYQWVNDTNFIFFKITEIPTLWLASTNSCSERKIASSIGRSLQSKSNHEFYYTQLIDSVRWIVQQELAFGRIEKIIPCLKGSEDFAIFSKSILLMGSGSKLYFYDINTSKDWVAFADFSTQGINAIKRISINNDGNKIAFVNDSGTP